MIHFIGEFEISADKRVSFQRLARFLARAVFFAAQYYAALGYTDEMLSLNVHMARTEDLVLSADTEQTGRCRIPEIQIHHERTVSDLISGYESHAARLLRSTAERFNFEPPTDDYFAEVIHESLQRLSFFKKKAG